MVYLLWLQQIIFFQKVHVIKRQSFSGHEEIRWPKVNRNASKRSGVTAWSTHIRVLLDRHIELLLQLSHRANRFRKLLHVPAVEHATVQCVIVHVLANSADLCRKSKRQRVMKVTCDDKETYIQLVSSSEWRLTDTRVTGRSNSAGEQLDRGKGSRSGREPDAFCTTMLTLSTEGFVVTVNYFWSFLLFQCTDKDF